MLFLIRNQLPFYMGDDKMSNNLSKMAYIFGAIYSLSNRLQTIGDKIDPMLSSKQWFVLAIISRFDNKNPNIGDVAQVLGTSRQNVKKIAILLEDKGYLEMKRSTLDSRNIQLFLTHKCIDYFKSREEKEKKYLKHLFSGMEEGVIDSLYLGLTEMINNTERLKNNNDEF